MVTLLGSNTVKLTLTRKFTAADVTKQGHFIVVLGSVTLESATMTFVELKGEGNCTLESCKGFC